MNELYYCNINFTGETSLAQEVEIMAARTKSESEVVKIGGWDLSEKEEESIQKWWKKK